MDLGCARLGLTVRELEIFGSRGGAPALPKWEVLKACVPFGTLTIGTFMSGPYEGSCFSNRTDDYILECLKMLSKCGGMFCDSCCNPWGFAKSGDKQKRLE